MDEKLKIEIDYPSLSQGDITIFKLILLPLELWCLILAFKHKEPVPSSHFYNAQLIQLFLFYKDFKKTHPKLYANCKLNGIYNGKFPSKDLREMEEVLRHKNKKFHSYRTIEKTLEELKDWGCLMKRTESNKKAKCYWFVNPYFFLKYAKQFKEEILI